MHFCVFLFICLVFLSCHVLPVIVYVSISRYCVMFPQLSVFLCTLQLKQLGHSVDKVEFIVMGGTFMALPEEYRDYFIRNLHDALSGHTSNNVAEAVRYSKHQLLQFFLILAKDWQMAESQAYSSSARLAFSLCTFGQSIKLFVFLTCSIHIYIYIYLLYERLKTLTCFAK